jgi:hypothetical protein
VTIRTRTSQRIQTKSARGTGFLRMGGGGVCDRVGNREHSHLEAAGKVFKCTPKAVRQQQVQAINPWDCARRARIRTRSIVPQDDGGVTGSKRTPCHVGRQGPHCIQATTSRTTATSHQLGTAHAESRHVHPPMGTQCGEGIAQLPSDVKHEQPHIHQTVALRTQTASYRRELWAQGDQVAHARPVSLGASGPTTTTTTAATTAARAGGSPRGPLGDDGTLHVPARRSTPRQACSAPQRPQHTPCTP